MTDTFDTGDPRILLSREDQIATIRIARPEKLNALDFEMISALRNAAERVDVMEDVRTVIMTGEGDRSFCAGGDIEAWSHLTPEQFASRWIRLGHRTFDALAQLKVPLIAALNGHCLGGGLELAATADFRIAESHVKIGLPETGIGVIPGWSGTQRLVRRFGSQLIRRMALGGDIFLANEARDRGLVDQVVEQGAGLGTAQSLARKIGERSPLAVRVTKQLINASEGEEMDTVLETLGSRVVAEGPELRAGVEAFRGKRKPVF